MSSLQYYVSGVIFASTLLGVGAFNGYYEYNTATCHFNPNHLSDVELICTSWFNKDPYIRFNSTVGEFVGYTAHGVKNAERLNKDPAVMAKWRGEKDRVCKNNIPVFTNNILSKTVEPEVMLSMGRPPSGGHPAMLMCSAYNFYPKMIRVKWYRDDQEVTTGDVISTEELADGDWYYQMHSHLAFTPKAGEKISCSVEHASLKEPKELVWDSSMPEPERNKIAIGAAGLVLGLIVTAAGFIYYRTKARGRILVPSG
ncbi:H-2 class II histocompatibility antigen, E-S beta chain-like isoform X2 [Alosa sapidissima]|uniref:H-2 class II histocompatibility antigen, E-S beta chain-like isoform X2 n=1 Tax=Alosa sapidissima TaxID=34773 RepID=UPI001C0A1C95|nr:H-2 class II histocompatibility antigen, E-S beta chain-like isoform X2 [Alosa sapidissima]